MSFDLPLVKRIYEAVSAASQILSDHGLSRDGIPDAWVSSLMRFKEGTHLPESILDDFDSLSDEMGRRLEACEGGAFQFFHCLDESRARLIECAYWKVHAAITQWLINAMGELMSAANHADSSKELGLVNAVLKDGAFWFVGEHAATFEYQPFKDWKPHGKAN